MKFRIEKKEISTLTTMVHRAASNKNTIPILSGLLMDISQEKGLTMTATDMEIGIRASTKNIDISEEGSVLVNANYLSDFIKLLPDGLIEIELNKDISKLVISYGRSKTKMNIYQSEDYPELPVKKVEQTLCIPQNLLKEGLKKTSFAAAPNHFRQVFTGVLFDISPEGILKIVASDTHRLAYFHCQVKTEIKGNNKFVIPIRTVNELMRLLDDNEDSINLAVSENNVVFFKEDMLLFSRLIEGQYPNYETVIPGSFSSKIEVKTSILAASLGRAKIMPTDDKFQIPHVQFSIGDNEVFINTYSENMGEISEVIDDLEIEGEKDLKIAFNTNYFLDAVKVFENECEKISLNLSGSLSPALVKNSEKQNYLYVLVPMRTN